MNGDENVGAICGDIENKENLYLDFFVDSGLGAVDGISYKSKAEPVSFEELQSASSIPRRFISFTITFIADDKIIEKQDIKYGDDTARIKYPEIPKKDGYFGNWQQIESKTVTEDIEVICEYQPYITVLSSVEKNENGKLSLGLVEGNFTDKAELHVTGSTEKPPVSTDGSIKVYDVSIINTDIKDSDTVTVRILNENKEKVKAWVLKDGTWEEIKSTERGKYVILEITGTKNTICLRYTEREFNFIWLLPALFICLIIAAIIIRKKS